jgi:hypothetical protein
LSTSARPRLVSSADGPEIATRVRSRALALRTGGITATSRLPSCNSSLSRPGTPSRVIWILGRPRQKLLRPDRAHQPHVQGGILQLEETLDRGLRGLGLLPDLLELRAHETAEVGQVGEMALAAEQEPAQLLLELLDGAGERRSGDVALLGGAREVERLADREEIADLVHFHRPPTGPGPAVPVASIQCASGISPVAKRPLQCGRASLSDLRPAPRRPLFEREQWSDRGPAAAAEMENDP